MPTILPSGLFLDGMFKYWINFIAFSKGVRTAGDTLGSSNSCKTLSGLTFASASPGKVAQGQLEYSW